MLTTLLSNEVPVGYLHGYTKEEQDRLKGQGDFLEKYVYPFVDLSQSRTLLEVGCGVGAQTSILLRRFPNLKITAVDCQPSQIQRARKGLEKERQLGRLVLELADASQLPYSSNEYDAAFFCWVLEHVRDPISILTEARRVLRPGGVIYATEVLNAPIYVYPESRAVIRYWDRYCRHQRELGGHPDIGAKLPDLFLNAGLRAVTTNTISYQLDARTPPHERRIFFEYWKTLFLSAAPSLLRATSPSIGISPSDVKEMENEFDQLKTRSDSLFFLVAMQARAIK